MVKVKIDTGEESREMRPPSLRSQDKEPGDAVMVSESVQFEFAGKDRDSE